MSLDKSRIATAFQFLTPPDNAFFSLRSFNLNTRPTLILGSTSSYRATLLKKLSLPFVTDSPEIDERPGPDEAASALVVRLAEAKARAVGKRHDNALIIGSDQVACIADRMLGKPGNREQAIEQLLAASGQVATFYTGLCLLNTETGLANTVCEPYRVHFRSLAKGQVERYVDAEQPFNCAGSFKSEGLGISLFRRLEGEDPNALIGLPLIRLIDLLREQGIEVP